MTDQNPDLSEVLDRLLVAISDVVAADVSNLLKNDFCSQFNTKVSGCSKLSS